MPEGDLEHRSNGRAGHSYRFVGAAGLGPVAVRRGGFRGLAGLRGGRRSADGRGLLRLWPSGDDHRGGGADRVPAIAGFMGKSPATCKKWILDHGLPAMKTPEGTWLTHKALILQWIYAGHKTEIRHIKRDQSTHQKLPNSNP